MLTFICRTFPAYGGAVEIFLDANKEMNIQVVFKIYLLKYPLIIFLTRMVQLYN